MFSLVLSFAPKERTLPFGPFRKGHTETWRYPPIGLKDRKKIRKTIVMLGITKKRLASQRIFSYFKKLN
jgi:hypothetical protein